jgi:hypothetical protein
MSTPSQRDGGGKAGDAGSGDDYVHDRGAATWLEERKFLTSAERHAELYGAVSRTRLDWPTWGCNTGRIIVLEPERCNQLNGERLNITVFWEYESLTGVVRVPSAHVHEDGTSRPPLVRVALAIMHQARKLLCYHLSGLGESELSYHSGLMARPLIGGGLQFWTPKAPSTDQQELILDAVVPHAVQCSLSMFLQKYRDMGLQQHMHSLLDNVVERPESPCAGLH